MTTRLAPMLPALVLALVSGVAAAQFLYKSTMPDGKVIYGDAPMKGAVKVEKTKPDTSKKGITASTPKEAEALKKMEAERSAGGATVTGTGMDRTRTMEETLRKLEASREKVKEPLEGERIGNAGGGSRFTDAYWERQKKYEQSLDALRQEVEKARATR